MKKIDTAKSAGEIVRSGINSSDILYDYDDLDPMTFSMRFATLEKYWEDVVGFPLAPRSRPDLFEYSGDVMKVTVNVSDKAVLTAAGFRRASIEHRMSLALGCGKVKVVFRVGPVIRTVYSDVYIPQYIKRAPVILSEDNVYSEQQEFEKYGVSEELAEKMARVKLSLEKISKRRRD